MIEFSSIDDSDGAAHLNRVSSNDAAISHQDTQAMCLNTVHADLSRHNMLWRPLVDLAQCFMAHYYHTIRISTNNHGKKKLKYVFYLSSHRKILQRHSETSIVCL